MSAGTPHRCAWHKAIRFFAPITTKNAVFLNTTVARSGKN
jgi:hypothetical protein